MSSSAAATFDSRPLVAVVCRLPVVSEGVSFALEEFARVRSVTAPQRDIHGLLRSLAPDAVVVDDGRDAAEAVEYALESGSLLVHVALDTSALRVLDGGTWSVSTPASPEAIRNLVVRAARVREGVG